MRLSAIQSVAAGTLLILATGVLPSVTQAQQVFRIVGPDGKVTFSDKPPPAASNARVTTAPTDGARGAAVAALPFELRRVAGQFPVTLYTGDNCGPCASARTLLTARGIPFTEKTVTSNEDADALKRLSGDNSLPFGTIGSQQLKGFSDAEWTQFLDAAGYPKSSVLPASYRAPAATPLVVINTPPAAAPRSANTPAAPSVTPPQPTADNPTGIRF